MQAFLRANTFNQGSRRVSAFTSSASQSAGPSRCLRTLPAHLQPGHLNIYPSRAHASTQAKKEFAPVLTDSLYLRSNMGPLTGSPRGATRLFTTEFLSSPSSQDPGLQDKRQRQLPLAGMHPGIPKMRTYLILLNWNLSRRMPDFWSKAGTRICADGGANRLHDVLPVLMPDQDPGALRQRFLPSVIKGDLDSVRPEVLAFYTSHGVPIVDSSADQDTTDLTKCIAYVEEYLKLEQVQLQREHQISPHINEEAAHADQQRYLQPCSSERQQPGLPGAGAPPAPSSPGDGVKQNEDSTRHARQATGLAVAPDAPGPQGGLQGRTLDASSEHAQRPVLPHDHQIIVLGALGGRLDHTIAAINTLHMYPHLNIILLGDGNMVRLLPRGRSLLRPDRAVEGPMCGLVPMRGPARASSAGLRWDLNNTAMAFGGLVSTSNEICADEIEIDSDNDLVWTVELRE